MTKFVCFISLALFGFCSSDKLEPDSYENGIGTSFTVPLNPPSNQYNSKVSKNSPKYSVSGDDLDRADLTVSSSYSAPVYQAPVNTYSAPENNLDSFVAPSTYSQALSSSYQTAGQSYNVQQPTYSNAVPSYSAQVQPKVDVAEDRDGAHHHHHDHGAAAAPTSFESAAPAQESSYQSQPVSTGNLYYYYYPVAAQPIVEKSDDDELDPLVLVLLPITLLIGVLALISIFNVSVTGRSFDSANGFFSRQHQDEVFGSWDSFQGEVDRLLARYYEALESESCMDRVVCELGSQANGLSGKSLLMTALDWIIPQAMQNRIETFKEAANEGYEVHVCKAKYQCDSQKLIQTRRK
jgi:hypothetical protein